MTIAPQFSSMNKTSLVASGLAMPTRRLFLLGVATIVTCSGCQYDPFAHTYLKDAPPEDRICGIWVIDSDRTTWAEARPLLEDGSIGPERGHLEIRPDGQFVVEDLPDFEAGDFGSLVLLQSARGRWWTNSDPMNDQAYLWFEFEEVNGEPVEDKNEIAYFRCRREDYFLHVIIWDPDTGDAFVMRQKGTNNKASGPEISLGVFIAFVVVVVSLLGVPAWLLIRRKKCGPPTLG